MKTKHIIAGSLGQVVVCFFIFWLSGVLYKAKMIAGFWDAITMFSIMLLVILLGLLSYAVWATVDLVKEDW